MTEPLTEVRVVTAQSDPPDDDVPDEWDEYEEAGPMDLEDQLDRLLEQK